MATSKANADQPNLSFGEEKTSSPWVFPVFEKTIRIAVSGDVRITECERKVIDTADFQRLQGVRQLGAAVRVYPTALHTRFDHSIGCLKMAERMISSITDTSNAYKRNTSENAISDEQRAIARLYALLHDITHVPFGHTLEDELRIFGSHDEPGSIRFERFLGPDSEISKVIVQEYNTEIYTRLHEVFVRGKDDKLPHNDEFIYHLVSDTVCADLLDYILRDSYFCHLDVGFEYRFLNFLYLGNVPKQTEGGDQKMLKRVLVRLWKGKTAVPRSDTLMDLCRLLEARYMISERVYYHHAKIVAGAMIGRAVQEAIMANLLHETDFYSHTDDTLIRFLCTQSKSECARQLAGDYKSRNLYKVRGKYTADKFREASSDDHGTAPFELANKIHREAEFRREIEDRIARYISEEPCRVLLYVPERDMNMKLAEAPVLWRGEVKELRFIDDPIVSKRLTATLDAHKKMWAVLLILHPEIAKDDKKSELARQAFESIVLNIGSDEKSKNNRDQNLLKVVQAKALRDHERLEAMQHVPFEEKSKKVVKLLDAEFMTASVSLDHIDTVIREIFRDDIA